MHPTVLCILTELEITLQDERFPTNVTCKQMPHSTNTKLLLQMTLPNERFHTHVTYDRTMENGYEIWNLEGWIGQGHCKRH